MLYKVTGKKAYISDPNKGLVSYLITEFQNRWLDKEINKGNLMILEPQADFRQKESGEKLVNYNESCTEKKSKMTGFYNS